MKTGPSERATESREYPARPLVGVGGVVLDGERVLLVRRARAPLQGEWSLPGGLVEVGETLSKALRREIHEETGLRVEVQDIVKVLDRITSAKRTDAKGVGSKGTGLLKGTQTRGLARKRGVAGKSQKPRRVQYHFVLVDFLCRVKRGSARGRSHNNAQPTLRPADDVSDTRWVSRSALGGYSLQAATLRVIDMAIEMAAAKRLDVKGSREPASGR